MAASDSPCIAWEGAGLGLPAMSVSTGLAQDSALGLEEALDIGSFAVECSGWVRAGRTTPAWAACLIDHLPLATPQLSATGLRIPPPFRT